MIGIINYGICNLASVNNALTRLGIDSEVSSDRSDASKFDRLILPGVGSFARAMDHLVSSGWADAIHAHVAAGKPLLGICLGMQLLFEEGEEHGHTKGLGIIPGEVRLMTPAEPHRLPHVGWNTLDFASAHPLFARVKNHVDVYFVHSYHCVPREQGDVVARCSHGGDWVASVARGCVAGVQFHPEKSQPAGLQILDNFSCWNGVTNSEGGALSC